MVILKAELRVFARYIFCFTTSAQSQLKKLGDVEDTDIPTNVKADNSRQSLLMSNHWSLDNKKTGLDSGFPLRRSMKFHPEEQLIDIRPPIRWQRAQPIDAQPPVDAIQSIADAAGRRSDDCFLSTF